MLGGSVSPEAPFVTEEELRMMVTVGEEEGVIEEEEREMIHSIFELADTPVREVMVPRIDIKAIEATDPINDAIDLMVEAGYSRIPVYEENLDNITGILYVKDIVKLLREGRTPANVGGIVRPARYVPELKKVSALLHELQAEKVHMAIVVDEYGGVSGLVTIEDLLEEIVGEIQDEYDREEALVHKVTEAEYVMDARITIGDLNHELDNARLSRKTLTRWAAWSIIIWARCRPWATRCMWMGVAITVLSTRGRRIKDVRVVKVERETHEELDTP